MRFKRHMQLERGLQQIDIAPLINMVFLLLIFFVLTSSFVMPPGIKVNLPKALTSEVVKSENLEVLISSDNALYINGRVTTEHELETILKNLAKRKPTILIKADRSASLGKVVEVWDMCRDLGISQINIATNQE